MTRPVIYHLDECSDCSHRNVCKYVDKIDRLVTKKELPINFSGASCDEYIPEDVVDDSWMDYTGDNEVEIPVSELSEFIKDSFGHIKKDDKDPPEDVDPDFIYAVLNDALLQVMDDCEPEAIAMCKATKAMFHSEVFTNNGEIITEYGNLPIIIEESIQPGYFGITFLLEEDDLEDDDE